MREQERERARESEKKREREREREDYRHCSLTPTSPTLHYTTLHCIALLALESFAWKQQLIMLACLGMGLFCK